MRYLLGLAAIVISLGAVWLIAQGTGREQNAVTPDHLQSGVQLESTMATAEAKQHKEQASLELPTSGPEVLTQREVLISRTMARARAMGEQHPELLDFQLAKGRDLSQLLYGGHEAEVGTLGSHDRQIYVVKVKGRFTPWDLPYEPDETWPRPGYAFSVFDAKTGEELGGGTRTESPSVLPTKESGVIRSKYQPLLD